MISSNKTKWRSVAKIFKDALAFKKNKIGKLKLFLKKTFFRRSCHPALRLWLCAQNLTSSTTRVVASRAKSTRVMSSPSVWKGLAHLFWEAENFLKTNDVSSLRFCQSKGPDNFIVKTKRTVLAFKSDRKKNGKGAECTIACIDTTYPGRKWIFNQHLRITAGNKI